MRNPPPGELLADVGQPLHGQPHAVPSREREQDRHPLGRGGGDRPLHDGPVLVLGLGRHPHLQQRRPGPHRGDGGDRIAHPVQLGELGQQQPPPHGGIDAPAAGARDVGERPQHVRVELGGEHPLDEDVAGDLHRGLGRGAQPLRGHPHQLRPREGLAKLDAGRDDAVGAAGPGRFRGELTGQLHRVHHVVGVAGQEALHPELGFLGRLDRRVPVAVEVEDGVPGVGRGVGPPACPLRVQPDDVVLAVGGIGRVDLERGPERLVSGQEQRRGGDPARRLLRIGRDEHDDLAGVRVAQSVDGRKEGDEPLIGVGGGGDAVAHRFGVQRPGGGMGGHRVDLGAARGSGRPPRRGPQLRRTDQLVGARVAGDDGVGELIALPVAVGLLAQVDARGGGEEPVLGDVRQRGRVLHDGTLVAHPGLRRFVECGGGDDRHALLTDPRRQCLELEPGASLDALPGPAVGVVERAEVRCRAHVRHRPTTPNRESSHSSGSSTRIGCTPLLSTTLVL